MRSPLESPLAQCCWVGWRGPLPSKWTNIEGEGPGEVSIHGGISNNIDETRQHASQHRERQVDTVLQYFHHRPLR